MQGTGPGIKTVRIDVNHRVNIPSTLLREVCFVDNSKLGQEDLFVGIYWDSSRDYLALANDRLDFRGFRSKGQRKVSGASKNPDGEVNDASGRICLSLKSEDIPDEKADRWRYSESGRNELMLIHYSPEGIKDLDNTIVVVVPPDDFGKVDQNFI